MRSTSTTARFSLALLIIALSYKGLLILIALIIIVIIPKGAIASKILSAQPVNWLINCIVIHSLKRASILHRRDY